MAGASVALESSLLAAALSQTLLFSEVAQRRSGRAPDVVAAGVLLLRERISALAGLVRAGRVEVKVRARHSIPPHADSTNTACMSPVVSQQRESRPHVACQHLFNLKPHHQCSIVSTDCPCVPSTS
jgi:hypothetical protein